MANISLDKSKIGARCQLAATVRHAEFAGLAGYVHKAVKSRDCYTVRLDNGKTYDAMPENVIFIQAEG